MYRYRYYRYRYRYLWIFKAPNLTNNLQGVRNSVARKLWAVSSCEEELVRALGTPQLPRVAAPRERTTGGFIVIFVVGENDGDWIFDDFGFVESPVLFFGGGWFVCSSDDFSIKWC